MPIFTADSDIPVRFDVSATDSPSIFTWMIGKRCRSGRRARSVDKSRRVAGLRFGSGEEVVIVIQRIVQRFPAGPAPQEVDHLVARDGMHPGRERLRGVIGMSLVVDGQQRLLHEILHFVGHAREPPPEKDAQERAQILQEGVVRGTVAGEPAHQEILQLVFPCAQMPPTPHVFAAPAASVTGGAKFLRKHGILPERVTGRQLRTN